MSKEKISKNAQEKNSSANSTTPAAGLQQDKKPSEPTGGSLPKNTEEGNPAPAQIDINKAVYSAGQIVSEKLRQLIDDHSESEKKRTENDDRILFLKGLTKPISRYERRAGKKPPLSTAQRPTAKSEIKRLELENVKIGKEDKQRLQYIRELVDGDKSSVGIQIVRERAEDDTYLKRNKNLILNNIVKVINNVHNDIESGDSGREQVNAMVRASKVNGAKAITAFQAMLIDFLRVNKQELAILCTGKEWFKKIATTKVKKALSNWRQRSGDLSF